MGTQLPSSERGRNPQFSPHVYCGQTAGWTKMPLGVGTEVSLGPGDAVLDGDPAPPKRCMAPSFRPMSTVANGWMDEDVTWYGSRPGHIVLDGDPAPPPAKGAQQPPLFSADVNHGHGRPSQLLLSPCHFRPHRSTSQMRPIATDGVMVCRSVCRSRP